MKTKIRKLRTVIVAVLCAIALCAAAVFGGCTTASLGGGYGSDSGEDIKSTADAPAPPTTVPKITWSAAQPANVTSTTSQLGCYQKHVTSATWWSINEMNTPSSSNGTCSFNGNYSTSNGQPVARAYAERTRYEKDNATPQYVHFKCTITIPAYTEYKVNYSLYIYIYETCNSTSSSASQYSWADLCWYGATDTGSTMHFGYHNKSSSESSYSGTVATRLHTYTTKNTSKSNSTTVSVTYTNSTGSAQTFTRYWGFFANNGIGSTYKFKYNGYATVTPSAPAFVKYVGPAKPSVAASEKVKTYNGDFQDFAISNIGSSTLTEVKYSVAGTDNVLFTYDPETDTATGNSHMSGNKLSVKDAGVYTLTFKRDPDAPAWSDQDAGDYSEVTVEMKPKPLTISWASQEYDNGLSGTDSMFFMLPSPNVTVETAQFLSTVKYYERGDYDTGTGRVVDGASDVSLADIQKDTDYYAVVDFDFATAGYNYTFDGDNFCPFSTKDGREIVVVSIKNSGEEYNGSSHPAIAEAVTTTGDTLEVGTDIDFRYTYYLAGDPQYDAGSDVPPTESGTYTLKVEIKPTYNEDYKPYDSMTFSYVIKKTDPVLMPILVNPAAKLYSGATPPAIVPDMANGGTDGTYTWDAGQTLRSGVNLYSYTFTPADTKNYNTVTDMMELTTEDSKMASISAVFDPDPDGDGVAVEIYDSWDLNDLMEYLTVSGVYNSGLTAPSVTGYKITGTLTAGTSILTVHYGTGADEVTCQFTVDGVIACVLQNITADFSQDGKVFTSSDVEDLKEWLEVRGTYNDGRDHGLIDGTDYDLSVDDPGGELSVGVATINVSYWYEGVEYTTSFPVNVKAVVLESIQADFQPGLNEVTSTTALKVLKNWLTVTGINNDGSDYETGNPDNVILADDYTLSGKLVGGTTSKITVKYQGKSTTFDVDIITSPYEGKRILLPVPDLSLNASYTGSEIDVLSGWAHSDLVDSIGGKYTAAGKYTLTLTIKDFDQYEWDTSSLTPVESLVKGLAKYALADDFVGYSIEDDTLTAEWEIAPAVLKGTWNESGTLDLVSSSYKGSFENVIGYKYFDAEGNEVTELYEGAKYTVKAELLDTDNFVLDESTAELLNEPHEYTVPKTTPNGFEKVWNTVKETMMQTWMGLPIWAWVLIGLAVLILLIIIIVVACKRRKTKEEKEAIKAAKEEEKARKAEEKARLEEEEKQRKEEEKRLKEEEKQAQKERLEAERELAKAKQEAELEKIRAQAGMAGMATMAVQQPQQQPVVVQQQPQPAAQQPIVIQQPAAQPVQQVQTVDNELLREMSRQISELRAENKITQAQLNAIQFYQSAQPSANQTQPQSYQQPQLPQMPVMQMPFTPYGGVDYHSMYVEERAKAAEQRLAEERVRAAEEKLYRATEQRAVLAEDRFLRGQYPVQQIPATPAVAMQMPAQPVYSQPNSVDMMGALVAATLKNMANGTAPAAPSQPVPELPQKAEQGTPVTAKYPSDAVITTTTTVDTTKNGAIRRSRNESENFDVDGFYDPLD